MIDLYTKSWMYNTPQTRFTWYRMADTISKLDLVPTTQCDLWGCIGRFFEEQRMRCTF